MRASSFIISLAALAGCYDAPRVEVKASRAEGTNNAGITFQICDPDSTTVACVPDPPTIVLEGTRAATVWLSAEPSFDAFIVQITLQTTQSTACVTIANGATTLHRTATITGDLEPVAWACPDGDPCETPVVLSSGINCLAPP